MICQRNEMEKMPKTDTLDALDLRDASASKNSIDLGLCAKRKNLIDI